ncbi:MAG: hypothetical protein KDD92_07185 [Caldilineaceae bacterium]|nr:hypothetical protein [Caldilineaceae bacterium]
MALNPDDANAYFNRGIARRKRGNIFGAFLGGYRAAQRDPNIIQRTRR